MESFATLVSQLGYCDMIGWLKLRLVARFSRIKSIAACNCGMVCGPSALSALALKGKTGSAVARKTIRKIRLIGPDTQ